MRLKSVVILGLILVPVGFGDYGNRLLRIDH
jgi:hypothetical protein